MSANSQTLIKEYKGKYYVFSNIQAESWCEVDEKGKIVEGRVNELRLMSADAVCDTRDEAIKIAGKLDEQESQFGEGSEYGICFDKLYKDDADVNIVE